MKAFATAGFIVAATTALCAPTALASGEPVFLNSPPSGLCSPHLLHNGNVLAQVCGTQHWYKEHPDKTYQYDHGAQWSQIADLPVINGTQYAPRNYASAVLPDGRLLIEGGEYNGGVQVWTNMGAIYNPSTNTWTPVSPPGGVTQIGNAPSASLKDGTFLLGTCCDDPAKDVLFNPSSLTWSPTGAPAGSQDGQGYELLPTGRILTLDISAAPGTQLYSGATDFWSAGSSTPASLADSCGGHGMGPAVVRGDNTVVAFGADTCGVNPVQTAIRDNTTGHWSAGPAIPSICGASRTLPCDTADAPAALQPDGTILFVASAGYGTPETAFFEFTTDNTIFQVAGDPSHGAPSYNFLVLPALGSAAKIMIVDGDRTTLLYSDSGELAAAAPAISTYPHNITRGRNYTITGTQLSGVTGGAYQSTTQSFTNFPVVIVDNESQGLAFGYTFDISTFSIAANAPGSFKFNIPKATPTGAATLYVVANGVQSAGVPVTVH